MERRKFIKTAGVATAGTAWSGYLMANTIPEVSVLSKPELNERLGYLHQRIQGMPPAEISMNHALAMTRSMKQSEGQPLIIRRAKAFYDVVDKIPIDIDKGELIVGNIAAKPRVGWFSPATFDRWKDYIPGQPIKLTRAIFGHAIDVDCVIPAEVAEYWKDKPMGDTVGHYVADYEKVLKLGFAGIIREIEKSRAKHQANGSLVQEKADFFEAATIAAQAAIRYAERHVQLAEEMARDEKDATQKAELLRIAEINRKCPAQPAGSFYEALQSFWMTHVLIHINSCEWSISPGRFDQYMHPFYQIDMASGSLTREQTEELMTCLCIKFNEVRVDIDIINYQNLMIGGVDEKGNDASNEISYLCLETQKKIKEAQPSLSMRWHEGSPAKLLDLASEVILAGSGRPALFGDPTNVAAFTKLGIPPEEAQNYAIAGCEEIAIAGKVFGAARAGVINNPKCLLNVLDKQTGFAGFNEVLMAYREELKKSMRKQLLKITERDRRNAAYTPHPFASLLFEDCIRQGKDITEGGVKYNLVSLSEGGCITAANSLYVIKKAVFDEKVFTLKELKQALDNNFVGYEPLQAYCINRVPKFGNDIDEIDDFAVEIADLNHSVIAELNLKTYAGGSYIMGSGISSAWKSGERTGATPDGRKAGKSFSVSYGPSNGTDRNGPTAMLNSVSKLKWENQPGGALTHVRLPYSGPGNRFGTSNVSALISAFFKQGGMGLHFSVVDAEILRAAIKDPMNHLDIMVRIGGYSAPFALLSPFMQQEILERTEQQSM
ncbi:MAG: hypothetical protein K9M45_01360 [Kiritimatiellales bacterium]|nr:hypothetical protein [Kiritimatiellales bacterium]